MQSQLNQALTFLTRDSLKNVVLLKMLHAYTDAVDCYYTSDPKGVLLLLPTTASAFDRETYPTSEYIVFLSTTSVAATLALLSEVPVDHHLIFKLIDAHDRAVIEPLFPLQRITAYFSYTCPAGSEFALSPQVSVSATLDARCLELYIAQGFSLEEVQAYFDSGYAISFALYQDDLAIAACFAYRDFDQIWEIGSLYTLPGERRRGHARLLVETALHVLLSQQRIPRYQVRESNRPSINLAEKLGLHRFLTTEHFASEPWSQP